MYIYMYGGTPLSEAQPLLLCVYLTTAKLRALTTLYTDHCFSDLSYTTLVQCYTFDDLCLLYRSIQ